MHNRIAVYLTDNQTVGVRPMYDYFLGSTSLLLPPGAENPSYTTAVALTFNPGKAVVMTHAYAKCQR